MKIKNNNGFVAMDATIAIIAVLVFSGLIISLMYNNFLENVKIKREALGTIYLTEFFENIGIAKYEDITDENISNLVPIELSQQEYDINIEIFEDEQEKITKKITATISYKLNNKTYQHTMERIKIKE